MRLAKTGGNVEAAIQLAQQDEDEEKKAAEAKRARLTARAKWSARNVNPFDVMDIRPAQSRGWDKGRELSEKQKSLLMKQGIDPSAMPYAQAKQLLNELFRRWNSGLCTFGQAKILRKRGLPTNVSRDEAKRLIDEIANKEGWKK
jgi:hypothetical protein